MVDNKTYIGIEEHNDWEGESWAHLFEDTEETRNSLLTFLSLLEKKIAKDKKYRDYTIEELYEFVEGVCEEEINYVNKWVESSYMNRLRVCQPPPQGWEKWTEECKKMDVHDLLEQFYKGPKWTKKK